MERQKSIKQRHIHLAKKPFAERAKEHCRQFTAFMFSNVGIIILVVLYMIGGKWLQSIPFPFFDSDVEFAYFM